jgi:hypothetical protein
MDLNSFSMSYSNCLSSEVSNSWLKNREKPKPTRHKPRHSEMPTQCQILLAILTFDFLDLLQSQCTLANRFGVRAYPKLR